LLFAALVRLVVLALAVLRRAVPLLLRAAVARGLAVFVFTVRRAVGRDAVRLRADVVRRRVVLVFGISVSP
jgi:hypothetical protein